MAKVKYEEGRNRVRIGFEYESYSLEPEDAYVLGRKLIRASSPHMEHIDIFHPDHPESVYPEGMEPLPDGHEFYDGLAELVEEHDDDVDRERLLYAAQAFGKDWLETYYMTGKTW